MILVTGASGNVGAAVVRDLRAKGAPVRAFVRDRTRTSTVLGPDVDFAIGDFDVRDVLGREPGTFAQFARDWASVLR